MSSAASNAPRTSPGGKDVIDVWVKRSFVLDNERYCPVLACLGEEETKPELAFWNPLRSVTRNAVRINWFDRIEEAGTVVVTPHNMVSYAQKGRLREVVDFNARLLQSGRKVVSFALTWEYRPTPGETVFASASYKKRQDSIPCPHWLYDWGKQVPDAVYSHRPKVGFVGNVAFPNRLNQIVGGLPVPLSLKAAAASSPLFRSRWSIKDKMVFRQVIARWVRSSVLDQLSSCPCLDTAFLRRERPFFSMSPEEKTTAEKQYLENLRDFPYRIIMRGDANAVFSLYEAMSAGRIPVVIESGMRLPAIPGIDWSDIAVFCKLADLPSLASHIIEFHSRLNREGFTVLCRRIKDAFVALSPDSFFKNKISACLQPLPQTIRAHSQP